MSDPIARTAADRLKGLYADYLAAYADMDRPTALERLIRGGPDQAERRSVTDFYAAVEAAASELREALTPADSPLAAEVIRFMILEAQGPDSTSQLTFAAAQALAIPLIGVLTPEEAAALLAGYTARYPKQRLLTPRQKELLRALKNRT